MKVKTLIENYTPNKTTTAQHGLSLYIEANSKKILFDMGQNDLFLQNAKALNVDIGAVDIAILSHGHYDHGGGAGVFLNENSVSNLYINENSFGDFYSGNGYIGIDKTLLNNSRVVFTKEKTELAKGITLFMGKDIPKNEKSYSDGLYKVTDGVKETDDFIHEQYLLIEEKGKRILISGCSHRGILNIMEYFKPDVFFGGFHVNSLEYDSNDLVYIGEKLKSYKTKYYTCHCTGIEAYSYFKSKFGNNLDYLHCGKSVEI